MGNVGFPFKAAWTRNDPQRSIQAEDCNTFEPLAVTVVKCFEPFTSAAVLLVQRIFDNEKAILKLVDRRLGYRGGKSGPVPRANWFELIRDDENRPDVELWEDWMQEVSTWRYKLSNHVTELAAYQLLHRLQGRYIPRLSESFVFVSPPSLLPFIPSPTSFKDSFSSISLALT
ncbi:hypothetical protein ARMGADRAFT_1084604 [Armillaria gallica]|uniref:Uncharacterized protein n=1 Tax=Armillaria gallica TaxID=47427 RepID=A0A2H3DHU6_ARMGA|nr:hypothetical protein ARMGADRAFT_1084604 [Armillaria gallica]